MKNGYDFNKGEKFTWMDDTYEVIKEADLDGKMVVRDQRGQEHNFNAYCPVKEITNG